MDIIKKKYYVPDAIKNHLPEQLYPVAFGNNNVLSIFFWLPLRKEMDEIEESQQLKSKFSMMIPHEMCVSIVRFLVRELFKRELPLYGKLPTVWMENVLTYMSRFERSKIGSFYIAIIKANIFKLEKKADPKEEAAKKIKIWNSIHNKNITMSGSYAAALTDMIVVERKIDGMYNSFIRSIMKLRAMPKNVLRQCRQIRRDVVKLKIESDLSPAYFSDNSDKDDSPVKDSQVRKNILSSFLSGRIGLNVTYSDCMDNLSSISEIFKFRSSNITPITIVATKLKSADYDFSLIRTHPKNGYPFWLSVQMDSEMFLSSAMLSIPQIYDTMKLGSLGELASGALINVINSNKASVGLSRQSFLQAAYYNPKRYLEPHDHIISEGGQIMSDEGKIDLASDRQVGYMILEADKTHAVSRGIQGKIFRKPTTNLHHNTSSQNRNQLSHRDGGNLQSSYNRKRSGVEDICDFSCDDIRSINPNSMQQKHIESQAARSDLRRDFMMGASALKNAEDMNRMVIAQHSYDEIKEYNIQSTHKSTATRYQNNMSKIPQLALKHFEKRMPVPSESTSKFIKGLFAENLDQDTIITEPLFNALRAFVEDNGDVFDAFLYPKTEYKTDTSFCELIGVPELRVFTDVACTKAWENPNRAGEIAKRYVETHGTENEYLSSSKDTKRYIEAFLSRASTIRERHYEDVMSGGEGFTPTVIKIGGIVGHVRSGGSIQDYSQNWPDLLFFRSAFANIRSYPIDNILWKSKETYLSDVLDFGTYIPAEVHDDMKTLSHSIKSLANFLIATRIPSFEDIGLQLLPFSMVIFFYIDL